MLGPCSILSRIITSSISSAVQGEPPVISSVAPTAVIEGNTAAFSFSDAPNDYDYDYAEIWAGSVDTGTLLATTAVDAYTATSSDTFDIPGMLVSFYVKRFAESGSTHSFGPYIFEVTSNTAPAIPTGLGVVVDSTTQVTLDWADNGESDLNHYDVQQAPDVGGNPGTWAVIDTNVLVSTKVVTGLSPATAYHWRVQAVDDADQASGYTSEVSATLFAAVQQAASFAAANEESLTHAQNTHLSGENANGFAVWGWFYLDRLASDQGTDMTLMSTLDTGAFKCGWRIEIYATNDKLRFRLGNGVDITQKASDTLVAGQWYWMCCQWDNALGTTSVYIDSSDTTVASGSTTFKATTATASSVDFEMGGDPVGSTRFLDGAIQAAGISNVVLTDADRAELLNSDVGALYSSLSGGLQAKIVAWWDLNEVSGTRIDETANSYDLTDSNTVTSRDGFIT